MSLSWRQRKTRLCALVNCPGGDDEAEGTAVDRLMHGQTVIGRTSKTAEIDGLRFQDRDLQVAGTLEYGQFGVIDVVTCRLDNGVYARKSIEKAFALRTREQCSPQTERDVLLRATLTDSPWAPHLLAAYQMPTHLHLVMDYAEGGTLWDVLESSPLDGKVSESDLRWWAPQAVSAIHWCHSQGFAHRDIKPHNFVLTKDAHILLIDFGSAAPLLPPGPDGSQRLAKEHCLVPCGTCDYISPEILKAHEEALVALEMEDGDPTSLIKEAEEETQGYGLETDWWSLGAMLYEMIYGVAPFFANEIRHTYQRIMNHEKSLTFPVQADVSAALRDLLRGLLTHAEQRLGRTSVTQITNHHLFEDVDWTHLSSEPAPSTLHLPHFTYNEPKALPPASPLHPQSQSHSQDAYSQGFAFSALFQSSRGSSTPGLLRSSRGSAASPPAPKPAGRDFASPALSFLRSTTTPHRLSTSFASSSRDDPSAAFIGFSWGPALDAFPDAPSSSSPSSPGTADTSLFASSLDAKMAKTKTPRPLRTPSAWSTLPITSSNAFLTPGYPRVVSTPGPNPLHYMTPVRAFLSSAYYTPGFASGPGGGGGTGGIAAMTPGGTGGTGTGILDTIRKTSTLRKTAPRRTVSDREAMKQLVEAVGMSARKKVLESGRKPRGVLASFSLRGVQSGGPDFSQSDVWGRFGAGGSGGEESFMPIPKPVTGTGTKNGGATTASSTAKKELRFFPTPTAIPPSEYNSSFYTDGASSFAPRLAQMGLDPYTRPITRVGFYNSSRERSGDYSGGGQGQGQGQQGYGQQGYGQRQSGMRAGEYSISEEEATESEGPPSPSPTPRPGSAMSRRSGTPTLSAMSAVLSGASGMSTGILSATGMGTGILSATGMMSGRRRSGSGSSVGGLLAPWGISASASGVSASGVGASVSGVGARSGRARSGSGSGGLNGSASVSAIGIGEGASVSASASFSGIGVGPRVGLGIGMALGGGAREGVKETEGRAKPREWEPAKERTKPKKMPVSFVSVSIADESDREGYTSESEGEGERSGESDCVGVGVGKGGYRVYGEEEEGDRTGLDVEEEDEGEVNGEEESIEENEDEVEDDDDEEQEWQREDDDTYRIEPRHREEDSQDEEERSLSAYMERVVGGPPMRNDNRPTRNDYPPSRNDNPPMRNDNPHPPLTNDYSPPRNDNPKAANDRLLDDLSKRHSRMMLDIVMLEERLERISRGVVWGRVR